MGNFASLPSNSVLNLILGKVFCIFESTKLLKINNSKDSSQDSHLDNIYFLNQRFQSTKVQEKHFVNVYRIFDHEKKQYFNMKLIPILNNQIVKETISNDMTKYINLTSNQNPGLVKIENFYFDQFTYNKNNINMLIVEEILDFITLKDFLMILSERKEEIISFVSNKLVNMSQISPFNFNSAYWKNELIMVFILLIEIVQYLHDQEIKQVNMNLFNIVIYKITNKQSHAVDYKLKFSDVEIPFIMKNLVNSNPNITLNHYYFDTMNNTDNQNLILVLLQLVYSISNQTVRNIFAFSKQSSINLTNNLNNHLKSEFFNFFLEKIMQNLLINHPDPLFKEDFELLKLYQSIANQDEKIISKFNQTINEEKSENSFIIGNSHSELEIGFKGSRSLNRVKNSYHKKVNFQGYLKIIFLVLEMNQQLEMKQNEIVNISFILLNSIKIKAKEQLNIYFKSNSKKSSQYLCLLIQKYITFIQNYYNLIKIDMMEIFNLILSYQKLSNDSLEHNELSFNSYINPHLVQEIEEMNKIKTAGLFPLLLSYVNNCEVDMISLFELIEKITRNSSLTIITLLERVNINLGLIGEKENSRDENILSSSQLSISKSHKYSRSFNSHSIPPQLKFKSILYRMLNKFSHNVLQKNYEFYHMDDILNILKTYPLIRRKKANLIEQTTFLIFLFESENFSNIEEQTYSLLLETILTLLLVKGTTRGSFLYSTCLSSTQEELSSNSFFTEFGVHCTTCKMNICIICLHRCHPGHNSVSLGYCQFNCDCRYSSTCCSMNELEVPGHIRKSYVNSIHSVQDQYIYDEKDKSEYTVNSGSKMQDKHLPKFNQLIKNPQSNVYISIDYETVTIQTKNPICQIIEVTRDNDVFLDITEETLYYFETEIILGGYYDQIAVGITSSENFPQNEFAGYIQDSIGYHADDGKCYVNSIGYSYGVKFGSYDVIGCGITMSGNVYFTHNGCILPLLEVKLKGNIYSIISLRGKYSSVRVHHISTGINSLPGANFLFKHHKQKLYKPPVNLKNYSLLVGRIIASNDHFMKNLNFNFKKYRNNSDVLTKFKKYSQIMHSVCKNDKNNKLQHFMINDKKDKVIRLLGDDVIEEVDDELKASPKIRQDTAECIENSRQTNRKITLEIQKECDININKVSLSGGSGSTIVRNTNGHTLPTPTNSKLISQPAEKSEKQGTACKCGKDNNCSIF